MIEALKLLYVLFAWGVCGAALLFSLLRWWQTRNPTQGWFTLHVLLFAIFSLQSIIPYAFVENGAVPHYYIFWNIIPLATIPATVFLLPGFLHSLAKQPFHRYLRPVFWVLSILLLPLLFVFLMPPESIWPTLLLVVAVVVLSCTGVYGMVTLFWLARAQKQGRVKIQPPWDSLLWVYFWTLVLILPLTLVVDLLQLPQQLLQTSFPGVMPLLGSILGGIWLLRNLKELLAPPKASRKQASAPLMESVPALESKLDVNLEGFGLSQREREVALLLLEGLSYQAIAEKLFISHGTVKSHVLQLYQKTNTRSKLAFLHAVRQQNSTVEPLPKG
jgi:DNA-binding CsgD family transcriptional regulator